MQAFIKAGKVTMLPSSGEALRLLHLEKDRQRAEELAKRGNVFSRKRNAMLRTAKRQGPL